MGIVDIQTLLNLLDGMNITIRSCWPWLLLLGVLWRGVPGRVGLPRQRPGGAGRDGRRPSQGKPAQIRRKLEAWHGRSPGKSLAPSRANPAILACIRLASGTSDS